MRWMSAVGKGRTATFFEAYGKPGKFTGDLWRDLQAYKNTAWTAVIRFRSNASGVGICHRYTSGRPHGGI